MKTISQLFSAASLWLLLLFTTKGFCQQSVDCQWGPFGEWSECDGCTSSQTRSRTMAVHAQFGGSRCYGDRTETQLCVTTKGCPLEEGCGDRFRCRSGKCVSQSLVCNGDQDCEEDGHDERGCDNLNHVVCAKSTVPPQVELLGRGFDVLSQKWRGSVINTKSFGGQCRTIYSDVDSMFYRLPLSAIRFSYMVQAQNDLSDDMYSSKWHYAMDIVKRGFGSGYDNYDFHQTFDRTQLSKLVVLKNDIEVAQFQSNSPQYIPISEDLWKALTKLPSVYDYTAYRKVLERFGTHYISEGSLGGSFKLVAKVDSETQQHMTTKTHQFRHCTTTVHQIFFFIRIYHESCHSGHSHSSSFNTESSGNELKKVKVEGGGPQHIAALQAMQLEDPVRNWELYSNWADSIRSFPEIIKKKLRPLSELVKEVQCAGVKKLYLRRAIEQYLSESGTCHCRPCHNNGLVVMDGDECKCICKPGTSGLACEQGADVEGQQGVIQGSWACWSAWTSCSEGRRTRSRSCSNPSPQNGGQDCIGEPTETSECEDQELEHLKTMEPQCFDQTLPASQKCGAPPALINGYILDPKDIYLVGTRVQYSCTEGYHLNGLSTLECTGNQTWSGRPGLCTASRCKIDALADDVVAFPIQQSYDIGERVTLSCPAGRKLLGEATVICDPSLNFSPNPANIKCSPVNTPTQEISPVVQCQPWEKSSRAQCVCKMPFECGSSLEVCTTISSTTRRRSVLMSVCKMHALQCIGKSTSIAEDSACKWPERSTTGCSTCHMWEACDDQTNLCRCKESAECLVPGIDVCVRVGDNATAAAQTMSECEAGLHRCKGEKVSVVSILPCAS